MPLLRMDDSGKNDKIIGINCIQTILLNIMRLHTVLLNKIDSP